MKKAITILTILLVLTLVTFGQTIGKSDSLKIMASVDNIFQTLKTADFAAFDKISTATIYCLPCFEAPDFSVIPYAIDKKYFFDNYLKDIIKSDYFIRATNSHDIIFEDTHSDTYKRSDIIVLFTIYKRNELAPGHEGGQFGLYLKKEKDIYKFAGLETIP